MAEVPQDWSWHWQRLSMFFFPCCSWFGVIHCNPFTDAKVETNGARITARIRICCRFISVSKWLYDINEPPRCAPWIRNPKCCINIESTKYCWFALWLDWGCLPQFRHINTSSSMISGSFHEDSSEQSWASKIPRPPVQMLGVRSLGSSGITLEFVVARQVPTQKLCLHSWFLKLYMTLYDLFIAFGVGICRQPAFVR